MYPGACQLERVQHCRSPNRLQWRGGSDRCPSTATIRHREHRAATELLGNGGPRKAALTLSPSSMAAVRRAVATATVTEIVVTLSPSFVLPLRQPGGANT